MKHSSEQLEFSQRLVTHQLRQPTLRLRNINENCWVNAAGPRGSSSSVLASRATTAAAVMATTLMAAAVMATTFQTPAVYLGLRRGAATPLRMRACWTLPMRAWIQRRSSQFHLRNSCRLRVHDAPCWPHSLWILVDAALEKGTLISGMREPVKSDANFQDSPPPMNPA